MKKELAELQPVLEKAAKETEELLDRLTVDKAEVNKVKEVVEKEEAVVSTKVAEVDAAAKVAQAALDEVLPPLIEAEK